MMPLRFKIGFSYALSYILLLALFMSGAIFLEPLLPGRALSIFSVGEGVSLIFVLGTLLPQRITKPSSFFIHLQFLAITIPMTVLYVAQGYPREYYYYSVLGFVVIAVVSKYVKLPLMPLRLKSHRLTSFVSITSLLGTYIAFLLLLGQGVNFNLDIWQVYEYRLSSADSLPGYFGYIFPWITKVLCPLALILAIQLRRVRLVIFIVLINTIIFGLTNHKLTLFTPVLVIGTYVFVNRSLTGLQIAKNYCAIGIILIGAYGAGAYWAVSLFARRALFVPSHLNDEYHDYFNEHGFMLWGHGVANSELRNGAQLVGENVFDSNVMSANTGWVGSGYMNAGHYGILFYAIVIGLIFSVLDSVSSNERLALVISLSLLPVISLLTSSDLPTSMLTHGGGLVILLLHINWPSRTKETLIR
jgi:hypothetical protein